MWDISNSYHLEMQSSIYGVLCLSHGWLGEAFFLVLFFTLTPWYLLINNPIKIFKNLLLVGVYMGIDLNDYYIEDTVILTAKERDEIGF